MSSSLETPPHGRADRVGGCRGGQTGSTTVGATPPSPSENPVTMRSSASASAPAKLPFFKRPMSRGLGTGLAGAALVFGIVSGAGTGADARSQLADANEQVTTLETAADTSSTRISDLEDDLAAAKAEVEDLEAVRTSLATTKQRVTELETAAATAKTDLAARDQRIKELETAAAAAAEAPAVQEASQETTPQSFVQAPPAETSNVSYKNCAAARAAGAAPVYAGDPGYGRHLDRDGDGVGCE